MRLVAFVHFALLVNSSPKRHASDNAKGRGLSPRRVCFKIPESISQTSYHVVEYTVYIYIIKYYCSALFLIQVPIKVKNLKLKFFELYILIEIPIIQNYLN